MFRHNFNRVIYGKKGAHDKGPFPKSTKLEKLKFPFYLFSGFIECSKNLATNLHKRPTLSAVDLFPPSPDEHRFLRDEGDGGESFVF